MSFLAELNQRNDDLKHVEQFLNELRVSDTAPMEVRLRLAREVIVGLTDFKSWEQIKVTLGSNERNER